MRAITSFVEKMTQDMRGATHSDALFEVIRTENKEDGIHVVMEFDGTVTAYNAQQATNLAIQQIKGFAGQNGISLQDVSDISGVQAEQSSQSFPVKLRLSMVIPHQAR